MTRLESECTRIARDNAARAGLALTAAVTGSRDWSSALFTGVRLTLALAVEEDSDSFEAWLAALPEAEWPLRGHFVASAEIVARSYAAATIELLVIEEA